MSNMKHLFKQMVFLTILLTFPLLEIHAQITIHIKDKPASEVVKQIEKVSKYRFFYKKGLLGMTTPITVEVNDQGIEAVMGQIVGQIPVSYTIKGDYFFRTITYIRNLKSRTFRHFYIKITIQIRNYSIYGSYLNNICSYNRFAIRICYGTFH